MALWPQKKVAPNQGRISKYTKELPQKIREFVNMSCSPPNTKEYCPLYSTGALTTIVAFYHFCFYSFGLNIDMSIILPFTNPTLRKISTTWPHHSIEVISPMILGSHIKNIFINKTTVQFYFYYFYMTKVMSPEYLRTEMGIHYSILIILNPNMFSSLWKNRYISYLMNVKRIC